MIKKLDAKLALVLTVVAALVVLLVGWFGLVSAERSKASHVDTQIAQSQDQLTSAQSLIATTSKAAADARYRAAVKVLPKDPRMSQVVRELAAASGTAGTQIDSAVPAPVTAVGTGQAIPIKVTIEGQYFAIRHFLSLLQVSASMHGDKVVGHGRLYSVDNIQFAPTASSDSTGTGAPTVKNTLTATIGLNVFIDGAPPAPAAAPPTTDSSSSDTTTTASGSTP